jgi:hypothetical protein
MGASYLESIAVQPFHHRIGLIRIFSRGHPGGPDLLSRYDVPRYFFQFPASNVVRVGLPPVVSIHPHK